MENLTSARLNLHHRAAILHGPPADSFWYFGGIGAGQLQANMIAIALGAGARVGIEDTIRYDQDKTYAATNEDLVRQVTTLVYLSDRTVLSPIEFRQALNI